jgi:hypothetical protein
VLSARYDAINQFKNNVFLKCVNEIKNYFAAKYFIEKIWIFSATVLCGLQIETVFIDEKSNFSFSFKSKIFQITSRLSYKFIIKYKSFGSLSFRQFSVILVLI